jgi:hypothetical protein
LGFGASHRTGLSATFLLGERHIFGLTDRLHGLDLKKDPVFSGCMPFRHP